MLRQLLTPLSALSLLLCIAAITLWVRSHRERGDQWWLPTGHGPAHLLLTSEEGRLSVFGPPAPGPRDAAVRKEIVRLRNDRMYFCLLNPARGDAAAVVQPVTCAYDSTLSRTSNADIVRPLVDMLDDPDRFMAAHFILGRRIERPRVVTTLSWDEAEGDRTLSYCAHYRDLEIRGEWNAEETSWPRADPAQIPTIRRHWYRQLGVVHGTIEHGWMVAASSLLPAAWAAMQIRRLAGRRRRSALKLCSTCGYDLRASPGRCPECGAQAPAAMLGCATGCQT